MSWSAKTRQSVFLLLLMTSLANVQATDADIAEAAKTAATNKAKLAQLAMTDVNGKLHKPFADKKTKAIVLIFVSNDCPVANAFQPSLREFEQAYLARGIRSYSVYCSPDLKKSDIEKHVKDFRIRMPAILDSTQRLGKLSAAKVTPEAIVVDRTGKIRYRGLINNLYAGYGKKRARPTEHFLRTACDALLAGKEISPTVTKPIGCFIHYESKKAPSTDVN